MSEKRAERSTRIVVIEDRREVLEVLERALASDGHEVVTCMDGETGLEVALDQLPDLVVVDIGLPRKSGLEVARELRTRGFRAPILMLTARDTVGDKVEGLDAGADDYLVKPFDIAELLARVRALLRRAALAAEASLLRVGDLVIDPLTREVRRGSREVSLTQKEYALLEYLARHVDHKVSRERISENVWKQELDPNTNIVDVYINYLRKKVDHESETPLLHTVRGVGYMLSAQKP